MIKRVFTALVGMAVVLAALFAPTPWPFRFMAALAATACAYELERLLNGDRPKSLLVLSCLIAFCIPLLVPITGISPEAPTLLIAFVITAFASVQRLSLVGSQWPAISCLLLALTQQPNPEWGSMPLPLALLLPIWAGDTAALLVGKRFGHVPMAPSISPNKTWEGAGANLAACLLTSLFLVPALAGPHAFSREQLWILGLATGVFGQLGDLFESYLKRRASVKDSGVLLPGHGGVLDRIDSLSFAVPAYYLGILVLTWIR